MGKATSFRSTFIFRVLVICMPLLLIIFCTKSPTTPNHTESDVDRLTVAVETLGSADSLYLAILDSQGRAAAVSSTVNYLNSHEEVVEAGMSPDSSVYAIYENGLVGCVYNPDLGQSQYNNLKLNRQQTPSGGGEATARAIVLLPFAVEFGDASEMQVVNRLEECFGSAQPITEVHKNDKVTVEVIAEALSSSPGVLHWSGHGVAIPIITGAKSPTTALMTGKGYDSKTIANDIINNYKSKALGSSNREFVVIAHNGKHYLAVLSEFIESNANFNKLEGLGHNASKSIVYIDCCRSGEFHLKESFLSAGADAYFGWDLTVMNNFAIKTHTEFYKEATDTCTAREAYKLSSSGSDPQTGATFESYFRDGDVMIRAQVHMTKDGEDVKGYSITVASGDETVLACFTDPHDVSKACTVQLSIPGSSPGSYDCVSVKDAVIAVIQMSTGKVFYVEEGLTGVSGTITVKRFSSDVLSGVFSGTLGYWALGADPSKDPPSETMSIENGFFKHTGIRFE